MVLGEDTLITLIVILVIAVILLLVCAYCCGCKPACASMQRGAVKRQLAKDTEAIERERDEFRSQIRDTLANNERERNDIRAKYQLK